MKLLCISNKIDFNSNRDNIIKMGPHLIQYGIAYHSDIFSIQFWIRILVAIFCGLILGLERQLKGKPVGIRTSILICLGTMMFMRLGIDLGGHQDPSRVLGQIITGVGFLGAGVIMNLRGAIIGVTSAAVVWLLAAIGVAVGVDRFDFAVSISILSVGILVGVESIEKSSKIFRRGAHANHPRLHISDDELLSKAQKIKKF